MEYEEYIEVNEISVPQYYQKYVQLFRNIWSEQKSFDEKVGLNHRELIALCDSLFGNLSSFAFPVLTRIDVFPSI